MRSYASTDKNTNVPLIQNSTTVAEPVEAAAEPVEAVAEPVEAVAEPVEAFPP